MLFPPSFQRHDYIFLMTPSFATLWCQYTPAAHSGFSVKSSNQPSRPWRTDARLVCPLPSAELSWALLKLATVRSNMHDGECGDSRRTRTYPAGDREHGHQLYRPNTPVTSHSPQRVFLNCGWSWLLLRSVRTQFRVELASSCFYADTLGAGVKLYVRAPIIGQLAG